MTLSRDGTLFRLRILERVPYSRVQLFNIEAASSMIGVPEATVHRFIDDGRMRGFVEIGDGHYRSAWTVHSERASHVQAGDITRVISKSVGRDAFRLEVRTGLVGQSTATARDGGSEAGDATLYGHFATFGSWTEINSPFEGRFMESIAPGAFAKTIRNDKDSMRVLLNHGRDSSVGNVPIAAITTLREDATGAYYEADLLEGLPPLIVSGLRRSQYGASFRFDPTREELVERPARSQRNPLGLPERTITEARVFEFGPVTFAAYATATADLRAAVGAPPTNNTSAPRFKNREEWLRWLKA